MTFPCPVSSDCRQPPTNDPNRAEETRSQRERDYGAAMAQFESGLSIVSDDGPTLTYIERCKLYMSDPPADDWDGVFTLMDKG